MSSVSSLPTPFWTVSKPRERLCLQKEFACGAVSWPLFLVSSLHGHLLASASLQGCKGCHVRKDPICQFLQLQPSPDCQASGFMATKLWNGFLTTKLSYLSLTVALRDLFQFSNCIHFRSFEKVRSEFLASAGLYSQTRRCISEILFRNTVIILDVYAGDSIQLQPRNKENWRLDAGIHFSKFS